MRLRILSIGALLMLFTFAGFSCSRYETNPADVPDPDTDEVLVEASSAEAGAADSSAALADVDTRQIVLAGGCFWCVEAVYQQLEGVLDVESGYAGGAAADANYDAVSAGQTGHAEVVRITYDPTQITYGKILKIFFSTAHDPTTLNRQGADVGTQYRSAIFYANDEQKQIAADYIQKLNESGAYRNPIVTTLEPLNAYHPAEGYHQDFAELNPSHPYIQGVSTPKVKKTQKAFSDLIKDDN